MVTCDDFYEKFERVGNFCNKSEMTAKQVENYIKYRNKYKLKSYSINRCALYPFMMIEHKKVLHLNCLKELRKITRKMGGNNITRRLAIEIINRVNESMSIEDRTDSIPTIRTRMDGYQHEINSVSFDVRNSFDVLKDKIGIHNNNDLMSAMINYCDSNKDALMEIKSISERVKNVTKDCNEKVKIISEM